MTPSAAVNPLWLAFLSEEGHLPSEVDKMSRGDRTSLNARFLCRRQTVTPIFEYRDAKKVGESTVFYGPAPEDIKDRQVRGKEFMVDGKVRVARAMESFCTLDGPSKGDPIGIIFFEDE